MGLTPTAFELWWIIDVPETGRTKAVPMQIDTSDPVELKSLACAPCSQRIGPIVYDTVNRQRLVQCGNGQTINVTSFFEPRPTDPGSVKQEPIMSTLLQQAVARFNIKQSIVDTAQNLYATGGIAFVCNGSEVKGSVPMPKDPATKYFPRIDIDAGTHKCSCRSTKANAVQSPCAHAVALLITIDMGGQPTVKPVKVVKQTGNQELVEELRELQNRHAITLSHAHDIELERNILSVRNEQLEAANVNLADQLNKLQQPATELQALQTSRSAQLIDRPDMAIAQLEAMIENRQRSVDWSKAHSSNDVDELKEQNADLSMDLEEARFRLADITEELAAAKRFIESMSDRAALRSHPTMADLLTGVSVLLDEAQNPNGISRGPQYETRNQIERLLN